MSLVALLTPARRDALLAAAALALLVAPVWAPTLHLGDPTYRYEAVRVTAADGTIAYADGSDAPAYRPVSIQVACTSGFAQSRGCYFERNLAADRVVPSDVSTGAPGDVDLPDVERYSYVVVNETVYETSYVANRSHENDGRYRVELALEPASAEEALRSVSVPVEDAPAPVREAAETGVGTAHREVDAPRTPVRLDDGSYYRVYAAGKTDPLEIEQFAAGLLRWSGFLVGVGLAGHLSRRVEVCYAGNRE